MKTFHSMQNIGKVKYLINYHDGIKTHNDGSRFFNITAFKNKKKAAAFEKELVNQGYIEKPF